MSLEIEDLLKQEFSNENVMLGQYDDRLIDFVKDLSLKQYTSSFQVDEEIVILKRKYHVSPKKAHLGYIYKKFFNNNLLEKNHILEKALKGKAMRSLSGVVVISVITSPYPKYIDKTGKEKTQRFSCKHDCHYCPRERDENGVDINPRSYLSSEPTVARGLQNGFDAVKQFNDRGFQYIINGHIVDKIELIVLGGTWTEYPREYQEDFIRDLFWTANTFSQREKRKKLKLLEEQQLNVHSKCRIIGLTLEMRPDSITEEEIVWLRTLGCTRVQLGVQHIDDKILKKVNRGCKNQDTINALKLLKDYGYKVDAHWMPDLPDSSIEKDEAMFQEIIYGKDHQFDQWKIYPTTVVPWTKIKEWFDQGTYKPYAEINPEAFINMLIRIKEKVPYYVRINRVIRDIPHCTETGFRYIYGGNNVTNLRQVLDEKMKHDKKFCRCIRCREVKNKLNLIKHAQIVVRKYESSGGIEYFISMESGNNIDSTLNHGEWYSKINEKEQGIIYGFCRLRLVDNRYISYLQDIIHCGLIRELHVYGLVAPKLNNNEKKAQHSGIGKKLMKHAEWIALTNGYFKMAVISGIGVQDYYKKLGYKLKSTYMIKTLPDFYLLSKIIIFVSLFAWYFKYCIFI
jgi:ELP3 family radical SAM enzyme/protein acetyltransferase